MVPLGQIFRMWKPRALPGHVPGGSKARGSIPEVEVTVAYDMNHATGQNAPSPLDIVFSCCVCQDTPSNIYKEPDDRLPLRQGADGPGHGFGRIPKLYLTGCAHVVCTKHFEGGGVPFHAMEQRPRAPCPYCEKINAENLQPQDLFALQGPAVGEHDPGIPATYFETPPGKLNEPAMEAVRFQYVSMLRYGSTIYLQKMHAEQEAANFSKIATDLRALLDQQNDPAWADRTRKMKLLGSIVGCLQNTLKRAKGRLQERGEDVTDIDEAMSYQGISVFEDDSNPYLNDADATDEHRRTAASTKQITGEVRLAQGSAVDLANLNRATNILGNGPSVPEPESHKMGNSQQSRLSKRKRVITPGDAQAQTQHDDVGTMERLSSRDAMPPPQLPVRNVVAAPMQQPGYSLNGSLPNGQQTIYQSPRTLLPHPRGGDIDDIPIPTTMRTLNRSPSSLHGNTQGYPGGQRIIGDLYQDTSLESLHEYPQGGRDAAEHTRTFAYDQPRTQRSSLVGTGSTRGRNDALDYATRRYPDVFSQELDLHEDGLLTPELYQRDNLASFSSHLPNDGTQSQMQRRHWRTTRDVPSRHFEDVRRNAFSGHNNSFSGNRNSTPSNGNSVLGNDKPFQSNSNSISGNSNPVTSNRNLSKGIMGNGGTYLNESEGALASWTDEPPYPLRRSTSDGELDNLQHPTPQRPILRSNSVSPVRRLTLPPSPRNTSASNMRSHPGLFGQVRSSTTNLLTGTPRSTGSHRQQLGQSVSSGSSMSQSPGGLTMRDVSPQRSIQPVQMPRARGFVRPMDFLAPSPHFTPRSSNARVWNGLSFANEPSIGDENVGGRRRARR